MAELQRATPIKRVQSQTTHRVVPCTLFTGLQSLSYMWIRVTLQKMSSMQWLMVTGKESQASTIQKSHSRNHYPQSISIFTPPKCSLNTFFFEKLLELHIVSVFSNWDELSIISPWKPAKQDLVADIHSPCCDSDVVSLRSWAQWTGPWMTDVPLLEWWPRFANKTKRRLCAMRTCEFLCLLRICQRMNPWADT